MKKDDREPDRKYIFPNEEMLAAEAARAKPDDDPKAAPPPLPDEKPKTDIAKPFEAQGVETYEVPPPNETVLTTD